MAYNGRVELLNNANFMSYDMFSQEKKDSDAMNKEAIKNIHINNELSSLFFSELNVNAIQEAIRYQVYIKSDDTYIIDKQSETELYIIMRGMYLQYGRHHHDTLEEVRYLNKHVIDYCVPKILNEIQIYTFYKNDIQKLPVPMDRGELASSKGTKVLVMKEF